MAYLKYKVYNSNTGKVCYEGIKLRGDYQDLYDRLRQILWNLIEDNSRYYYGLHTIYGNPYYGKWMYKNSARLKCAFGVPYLEWKEGSICYSYSIVK